MVSWFQSGRVYYLHKARTGIAHLSELLRLDVGDEILMPSYNCGTEVDPFLRKGLSVVLYRVDKLSRIDVADLQDRVTKKTKCIYVTHYFGFPQSLGALKQFCRERGLYLIEDCALSLFSADGTTKLGTLGDVAVFSFPKSLPVPDGGALVVNNSRLEVAEWRVGAPKTITILKGMLPLLKAAALRGLSRRGLLTPVYGLAVRLQRALRLSLKSSAPDGWSKLPESYYYSPEMTDRKMSLLTRRVLSRFDFMAIIEKRRANFQRYVEIFSGYNKITPLFVKLPSGVCPLHFPILVQRRNQVYADLNEKGIDAIPWWAGYHRELSWKKFDEARFLKDSVLALPIHQDLDEGDMEFVAENLLAAA